MHFKFISYFYLVGLVVFLATLFWLFMRQKRKRRALFADQVGLKRLAPQLSTRKHYLKFYLFALGLLCIILALANPQAGKRTTPVERTGIDLFIALDISKSMLAQDLKPDRMVKAKQLAQNIIDRSNGDRIGLILFAGQAFVQMPLTVDYAAASMFIRSASPKIEITQGTAIEKAIDLVRTNTELQEKKKERALVIITDGENHEQTAIEAAKEAKEKGVSTYIIVTATKQGAPIPEIVGGMKQYKMDNSGQIVQSKPNMALLNDIASAGGGEVFTSQSADVTASKLIRSLSGIEKSSFEKHELDLFISYYQYPLGIALVLFLFFYFIGNQKSPWLPEN